jgi:hypothetical protein
VLATLLHEAAHALAHKRGVKDTSRQGRYHNRRFKALAEELGLHVDHDPRLGWSPTTLPDVTAARYAPVTAALERAITAHRHGERNAPGAPRGGRSLTVCVCAAGGGSGSRRQSWTSVRCSAESARSHSSPQEGEPHAPAALTWCGAPTDHLSRANCGVRDREPFFLSDDLARRPVGDPERTFVIFMCAYAGDVLRGDLSGPYSDHAARRYAHAALVPEELADPEREQHVHRNLARTARALGLPVDELEHALIEIARESERTRQ